MFQQSARYYPCNFADEKQTPRDQSLRSRLSLHRTEHCNHFFAEDLAVRRRVKKQKMPIDVDAEAEHRSSLLPRDPQARQPREMLHAAYFKP